MRPAFVTIGVSALLFISGCASSGNRIESVEEYERGSQQAVRDILRGQYRTLDNLGITRYRTEEMRAELRRRYGIQYEFDHSKSSDYVRGYNVVMRAGAKEKFGDNYYEKALKAVYPERQSQFAPLLNQ